MSYLNINDSIIAQCTARGRSSIDVIRISGKDLVALYQSITQSTNKPLPNQIVKKSIYGKDVLLDVCLVAYFKGPRSFTGDDLIEINCHGGDYLATNIIKSICDLYDVRMALPGEFSFRAYYNGKVDLLQAESINDIVKSETNVYANKSLENIEGRLSKKMLSIRKNISTMTEIMEHELDFNEEEISFTQNKVFKEKITLTINDLYDIKNSMYSSKIIRNGLRVVLIGRPNVGKSSLFNALVGHNRAIVSSQAGTTRDTVEALLEIEGHKVRLIDTAGYWEGKNVIEKLGIKKTEEEIIKSDILIFLGRSKKDLGLIKRFDVLSKTIKVLSKLDISNPGGYDVALSTKKDVGLDDLLTSLSTKINNLLPKKVVDNNFLINSRQEQIILNLELLAKRVLEELDRGVSYDIIASILHEFIETLNELIHPINKDDILNNVFANFCVGK